MKTKFTIALSLCLFSMSFVINQDQSDYEAIYSGVVWFDQLHNEVNAHGSCIVKEGSRYYLFGEYHSDNSNAFNGFSCYSSSDLMNWKFERLVLPVQPDGLLGPNRVGERVKVMKCPETGEFVMYMHTDDLKYTDPRVGYATCKTINGDYQFQGALLQDGKPINKWDIGTFSDWDGKGYLLTHSGFIYELSPDYKSVKRMVCNQKLDGESPALFKSKGVYYWLFSNRTSWERNDNYYLTATSLEGPWTRQGLFAPEGSLTWDSQCSFVLPVVKGADTLFVYLGDRWSYPKQGSAATYVWQPITLSGGKMSIPEFQKGWKLDQSKKMWSSTASSYKSIFKQAIIVNGNWLLYHNRQRAREKGAVITFPFTGTQVGLTALSNNTSGYARVEIKNARRDKILSTIVDFYSKNEYSSQKFLSPAMKYGKYILSIEVLGEHPVWSDKRFSKYGSTDDYVVIEDVYAH